MKVIEVRARDIRFPTSREKGGSDALNFGDYSAAYVTLTTEEGLERNGLTFTNGRGNELCVAAIHALKRHVLGRSLEGICGDMRGFYRDLTLDSQLRWLGPEKGILHMSTGALINAVWDLWAKREGKPLWKLLVDLPPEQLVSSIEFSYITDVLTPEQALALLQKGLPGRDSREAEMRRRGYPAYTTSTAWLGYSDQKVRRLCREAIAQGWKAFKAIKFLQVDSCRLGGVNEELAVILMAAHFGVPVCPHGGGVGLCEYVQHLAIFDYLAVSNSLEDRVCEYVDHLHEHFIDPCVVRDGRYLAPITSGYSIAMKPESLIAYEFPTGSAWQS